MEKMSSTAKLSIEGIEEIILSSINGNMYITKAPETENEISWETKWKGTAKDIEVIKESNRLIIRFDDKENFMKKARSMGIKSFHFTDYKDFLKQLENVGVFLI